MPNIFITMPRNAYPGEARSKLTQHICDAAAEAEQIPNVADKRALCWVAFNEVDSGALTCGGQDVTMVMLPCIVFVCVPAGVLDAAARERYVQGMHAAFQRSLPEAEKRRCVTSVIVQEVADGHWGVSGQLWRLPQLARAAGYVHLQHLVM